MAFQKIEIKSMDRLAHFEHYKVGYVGDVIHRPLADRFEPLGQPRRRRSYLDSADQPRGITRTEVGIEYLHRSNALNLFPCLLEFDGFAPQASAAYQRRLSSNAQVRERIRPVG